MQEGLCVHVPCTLSYPQIGWRDDTPAFGYWFTAGSDSAIGRPVATNNQYREVQTVPPDRFQLIGDPKSQSCSLLIKEAQVEDTAMYFFRVERGRHVQYNFLRNQFYLQVTGIELAPAGQWGGVSPPPCLSRHRSPHWERGVCGGTDQGSPLPGLGSCPLSVSALTQKPEVFVPEVLESGRQVTLICVFNWAFEECPAPTFSWMGAAVSDQRSRPTSSYFSMLILTPRPQDHGTHLTCRVEFAGKSVSTEKTVQLNVACESGGGASGCAGRNGEDVQVDRCVWRWVPRGQC